MTKLQRELETRSKSALSQVALKRQRPIPEKLDLLYGVRAIARFLTLSKGQTRGLIKRGSIPTFELDGVDCALRTSIFDHLKTLEAHHGERP